MYIDNNFNTITLSIPETIPFYRYATCGVAYPVSIKDNLYVIHIKTQVKGV